MSHAPDVTQFEEERAHIESVFTPLVEKCKALARAMRIGVNHGSLSARILSYYGDTPAGMVASAFEFADVCRKHDYHNFVFSMKVRRASAKHAIHHVSPSCSPLSLSHTPLTSQ